MGIGKNLEVSFVWRELRRVVDICEVQAGDSEVSKFRVRHVLGLHDVSLIAKRRLGTHVWRS